MKYIFTKSNGLLNIDLENSLNEYQNETYSYESASVQLNDVYVDIYNRQVFQKRFEIFNIDNVDGVVPTDIGNAYDLILALISSLGISFKTINGESILGIGDIVVTGGGLGLINTTTGNDTTNEIIVKEENSYNITETYIGGSLIQQSFTDLQDPANNSFCLIGRFYGIYAHQYGKTLEYGYNRITWREEDGNGNEYSQGLSPQNGVITENLQLYTPNGGGQKVLVTSVNGTQADEFGNVEVTGGDSYSTNETLTGGTWIDGKPIYRKVKVFTGAELTATGEIDLSLISPNIATTVDCRIITNWMSDNGSLHFGNTFSAFNQSIEVANNFLYYTNTALPFDTSVFDNITVTLEYTKTT